MFGSPHDIDNSFSSEEETVHPPCKNLHNSLDTIAVDVLHEEIAALKEENESLLTNSLKPLVIQYTKDIQAFIKSPATREGNSCIEVLLWEDEYTEIKNLLEKLLEGAR